MNPWLGIALGVLLTIGTGLFVAAEFSLVNLDRNDLETRRDRGERGLSPTISALRITSTHLSSAQLGITLTTLLTGYTFEPALSALLEDPLATLGVPDGAVRPVGAVSGVLIATLLSMLIGELVPKNFAIAVPARTARLVVPFQATFTLVFKPAVLLLNNTANALIRRMGIEPQEELSGARSSTELTYLVRHSADSGMLEEDDADLLHRTLRFSRYDASDVLTPRVSMVTVDSGDSATEVIATSAHSGYSRMPVLGEGPDDVVGIVHVKAAFAVPLDQRDRVTAEELMVEAVRVPDTMDAAPLLQVLRERSPQIAIVTDEYGGTAGLVTLEDLVEEIVGELTDEHDRHRAGLTRRGTAVSFDASWRPDELRDRAGVEVPEAEDRETVAGFVVDELDRIPEVGDEVDVPGGTLRVERMDGARVARLLFLPAPEPAPGEDGDGDRGDEGRAGREGQDRAAAGGGDR